jgi:segregation and condensation protein B
VSPLAQLLEAALFSACRPLTAEELATLDVDAGPADVRVALEQLREHYDFNQHGVELVEMAGGYQIITRPVHAAAIERAQFTVRAPKLTAATLETLAVIAYRQPVGRLEIEEIRGVSAGGVLRSLQERGLIEVVGRSEALGGLCSTVPRRCFWSCLASRICLIFRRPRSSRSRCGPTWQLPRGPTMQRRMSRPSHD